MPRNYTKITPQIVDKTKKYLNDPRNFSKTEVMRLMGISEHSLRKIVQGHYDQVVEESQVSDSSLSHQGDKPKNITEIPFERLEHLLKCEMFVEELFSVSVLSDKDEDELYFPRRYTFNMCTRYFPEPTQQRVEELHDTNA